MRYGSTTLTLQIEGAFKEREERIEELEAKCKRYEEALKYIADGEFECEACDSPQIARKALARG